MIDRPNSISLIDLERIHDPVKKILAFTVLVCNNGMNSLSHRLKVKGQTMALGNESATLGGMRVGIEFALAALEEEFWPSPGASGDVEYLSWFPQKVQPTPGDLEFNSWGFQ